MVSFGLQVECRPGPRDRAAHLQNARAGGDVPQKTAGVAICDAHERERSRRGRRLVAGERAGRAGERAPGKAGPEQYPNSGAVLKPKKRYDLGKRRSREADANVLVAPTRGSAPEVHRRIGPPGPESGHARRDGMGIPTERVAEPQIARGERVPLAGRPHGDVLGGPFAHPGEAAQLPHEGVEAERPVAAARSRPRRHGSPRPAPRHPERRDRGCRQGSSGSGNRWVRPSASSPATGVPYAATTLPARRVAWPTEIC